MRERAKREWNPEAGNEKFPNVVVNPTEAELQQAAEMTLTSGRLLPNPFVFHGEAAQQFVPPVGVVMEQVEHGCVMMRAASVVELARETGTAVPLATATKSQSVLDRVLGEGWRERALEAAMTPVEASAEPKRTEEATPTPPSVSLPDVTLEAGTPVVTDEFQEIEGDELPDHLK